MDSFALGLLVFAVFVTAHVIGSHYKLYQKGSNFDMLTHFLGGLCLSFFIKNSVLAIFLLIGWELIETNLTKPTSNVFRETLTNKLRDLAVGMAGFLLGLYIFG